MKNSILLATIIGCTCLIGNVPVQAQIGHRFPSEKKVMKDTVTGTKLTFLTSTPELEAGGDMALDGDEEWVWFRIGKTEALKHLPEGTKIEEAFGPRKMGAGPAGIAGMNIRTEWVSRQAFCCWRRFRP